MKVTRFPLAACFVAALVTFPSARLAAQDAPRSGLRIRPNIDDLTQDQIDVLEAAMKELKSQPAYLALQQRHDGGGPFKGCEHGSEAFLPWHRELMLRIELALRSTGVDGAEDITLPYWDWSKPFKGKRYPMIAEDPDSEFFARFRWKKTGETRGTPPNQIVARPLPLDALESALEVSSWKTFGGGLARDSTDENPLFGALERPHNVMHVGYVGGFLTNVNTAAKDPLFWLFHCGIDYYWWKWQQDHPDAKPAEPDWPLQDFDGKTISNVWDTTQLGYTYAVPRKKSQVHPGLLAMVKANAAENKQTRMSNYSFDLKIPNPGFTKAELHITGVKAAGANSHLIDYYLYPADLKFAADDPQFLKKYLAATDAHFGAATVKGAGHKHHPPRSDVRVNVTKPLARAAQKHAGETWKFTVVYQGGVNPETQQPAQLLLGQDVNHGPIHLVLDGRE